MTKRRHHSQTDTALRERGLMPVHVWVGATVWDALDALGRSWALDRSKTIRRAILECKARDGAKAGQERAV